jgi:hypothetical protein
MRPASTPRKVRALVVATLVVPPLAVSLAGLFGQQPQSRPGMPDWSGTIGFHWKYKGTEQKPEGIAVKTIERDQQYDGELILTPDGTLMGSASYKLTEVRKLSTGGGVETYKESGSVHKQLETRWVQLYPSSERSYTLIVTHPSCPADCEVTNNLGTTKWREKEKLPSFFLRATGAIEGKTDFAWSSVPGPVTLSGSVTQPAEPKRGKYGEITYTWNVTRKEKLEVVVEPKDYDRWIPKGTQDEDQAGNSIAVKATLKTKDGSPLPEKARKFTFELVNVSREPGVCMNYPARPKKDPDPDLQFDQDAQKDLTVVDDQDQPAEKGKGLKARSKKEGEYTSATAVVGAYDFGAYGAIRVTAEMPDKRKIVGYLQTDKKTPDVRLPRRKENSFIADAWKEKWKDRVPKIFDLADDDDTEEDPHGGHGSPGPGTCRNRCAGKLRCLGGHNGDGLTLYEEYRGFYVGGKHKPGDPSKKDVFVHRRPGTSAGDGVMLFQTISGLVVHDGLTKDEIGPEKQVDYDPGADQTPETVDQQVWVNANVSDRTPTKGAKFGILISRVDRSGPAVGYGYPGVPKKVAIGIDFMPGQWMEFRRGTGTQVWTDRYPKAVAHELLHCCNVDHHGPRKDGNRVIAGNEDRQYVYWKLDGDNVWETDSDANQNPIPATRHAIPLGNFKWEDGKEISRELLRKWLGNEKDFYHGDAGALLYLACQGGEHSGYQNCVMRYDAAAAFIPRGPQDERRLNRKSGADFELVGMSLCDQQGDTAVSGPLNLPPLNRYGDAPNGFCRSQICVNDWMHAKP